MKRSLIILSLFGLGATQANAEVEQTFPAYNMPLVYSAADDDIDGYDDISVDGEDEISQAIQQLSAQAQQREDRLAALSEKLSQQSQMQTSPTYFGTSANRPAPRINSNSAPAIAAARAAQAAHSRSIGRCARYVRKALQAAGYEFTPNASAYQYATRGTLANAGFVKVSNNTPPQIGDVVVYNRSAKHKHGHIQIFDGTAWVSDFRQNSINPYSGGNYSYTTWRDARYTDNASNNGIYLAMNE
ncbi:CHAP domain-containing protein [Psychrobacter sp. I-STPA10]|uniref:CHAP domain-containing protein n=1 Tax=Psychrobacter sp. I-STPA10 TaxID=2585769 RepID=UPI001E4AD23F|nr:CHAP domain-containing protein [Psychrobacter sp. I-STPA10]